MSGAHQTGGSKVPMSGHHVNARQSPCFSHPMFDRTRAARHCTTDDQSAPVGRAGSVQENLFLANLSLVEKIVSAVCDRTRVVGDDMDEFRSYAMMRLTEKEYAVFTKFRGRSSLKTYLTVVIMNCLRDFRAAQWGRWRPSAEALRLGPLAVRLERLLFRDGWTLREANEVLRSSGEPTPSDKELARLGALLPQRIRPMMMDCEHATDIAAVDAADAGIEQNENDQVRQKTFQVLEAALRSLPEPDRTIVRLRFLGGHTIADIARILHMDQRPLYRRLEANQKRLRRFMENEGITRDLVVE